MPKIEDLLKKMDVEKIKRRIDEEKEAIKNRPKSNIKLKNKNFKKVDYRPWDYDVAHLKEEGDEP